MYRLKRGVYQGLATSISTKSCSGRARSRPHDRAAVESDLRSRDVLLLDVALDVTAFAVDGGILGVDVEVAFDGDAAEFDVGATGDDEVAFDRSTVDPVVRGSARDLEPRGVETFDSLDS